MPKKREPATLQERFEEHTNVKAPPWVCWPWLGPLDSGGRGCITTDDSCSKYMARRVSYELYCGAIPPRRSVKVSCGVPGCVNPAHLYISGWRDARKKKLRALEAPADDWLQKRLDAKKAERAAAAAKREAKKNPPPRKDGRPRIKFKTFRDGKWR
jgi:hypothetical protein